MGYSARYHAASLAAVFLALAVGILIGVGFGSDVVTGTAEDLEESLASDLDEARAEVESLRGELEDERRFGEAVFPTVVGERLRGVRVAVIGLGSLSESGSGSVEAAIGAAGGDVGQVAVVGQPPDLDELAGMLDGRRARAVARGEADELRALGVDVGRLLLRGGARFDELRGTLLSRYSGRPGGLGGAVVVRDAPAELEPAEQRATDALSEGLLAGLRSTGMPVVGTELSSTEPSAVEYFRSQELSTVDSVDRLAGKVALVYVLSGDAEGSFGVKEGATSLLPDLLGPPREAAAPGADRDRAG